jgi:hypothetical protein
VRRSVPGTADSQMSVMQSRADENAIDMNAPAPPLRHNPSAWPHRILTAVVAACGAGVAAYLGLYQWRLISSVWDPVFGPGSERMLTSRVSQVADRVFHVPDAVLGALGYTSEIIFSLSGCTRRWQHRPWLVVLLGLTVLGIGCVSAALVCAQGLIVRSWCFLCLVSAALSFTLVILVAPEVYACLHYLGRVWRQSHSPGVVWNTFWGRASDEAARAALSKERECGRAWSR